VSSAPTIVVIGSPNAGKSTLVNRLSGSRSAVVHATPGVTRDRKEVETDWAGRALRLVDTGGFDTGDESPYAAGIREQVRAALAAADVVLFLVDGRAGPLGDDFSIADEVRRQRVPCLLVANKLDDPAAAPAPELYELGLGEPVCVSAAHGLGTGDLLDRAVALLPDPDHDAPQAAADNEIPVAIVGRPNAGKSSLFNAIVGEPRVLVSDVAGTTRDAIDTSVETAEGRFRFVDTAGMRKAAKISGIEYYSYLRSLQSLDRAHVAIIVADATLGLTELDFVAGVEATQRGCATVVVMNKWDVAHPDLDEARALVSEKLRQRPLVLPVSAKTHEGVHELLDVVADLHGRYTAHIATPVLNRFLGVVAAARSLPSKHGKRLKMYYMAQYETAPPRFAIEVNDRSLIKRDFGFFVENRLRDQFGLAGVPVIIDFKGK